MDLLEFVNDLDRCKHGRHQFDPCFSCPGGQSTGNAFLHEEGVDEFPIGVALGGSHVYVLRRRPTLQDAPIVIRSVNRETGEVVDQDLLTGA